MTVIEIERKVSFGNFENIGMRARLEPGEIVSDALVRLENIIQDEINNRKICEAIIHDIDHLGFRKEELQRDIIRLTMERDEIRDGLSAFEGWIYGSEIPF